MGNNNNIKKPKDLSPGFIKGLEKKYGPVDMENDFFSADLSKYYKISSKSSKNKSATHKIIGLASFKDSFTKLSDALQALISLVKNDEYSSDKDLIDIAQKVKDLFNKYRTHLRTDYPEQYNTIQKQLDELSTTGGGSGAASFSPGKGMQYATPKAFNKNKKAKGTSSNYSYKLGYKPVPKKIKGSGLEVKKLFNEEEKIDPRKAFQKERISAFDQIEQELNNIYKLLSNAKNETSEYYNDNPSSYEVVKPTDLILDYIQDIKSLLTGE